MEMTIDELIQQAEENLNQAPDQFDAAADLYVSCKETLNFALLQKRRLEQTEPEPNN